MQRRPKLWIALAALMLAGWLSAYIYINQKNLPVILEDVAPALSNRIAEWQGRIDYRLLDRDLVALAQRPEMAGLAVAVVEDGEIRFVRTYGVSDLSTRAAVTPDTVFRWASVSKTATGALAAKLTQEGKLDLQQPLTRWQTSLRLPQGAESRITLEQLLAQQSGLTKNAYDEKLEAGESPVSIRTRLSAAPLQCQPGTCHTYQNIAFDAASEILAQASGAPFDIAVSEQLFRQLGLVSARYGMEGLTGAKDWARPHNAGQVRDLKEAYWRVPAAAGVNSNIGDFAKWMQAMMGLRPDILTGPVLQIAAAPRVATPRLYSGDLAKALSDAHYGLGLRSFRYGGRQLLGHSGAVAGYRATMIFEPATQTGVVAMWNSNWGVPFRIPFAVLDNYHKVPGSRWLDLSDVPLPLPNAVPVPEE
jgi:beta-lactamase class C